jgi:orotate phosphoribosyltransferase
MKNIEGLIDDAIELAEQGHTKGEIADELNISRETATWLVDRGGVGTAPTSEPRQPHDIHVDWSTLGRGSNRLYHAGAAMADLLGKQGEGVDLTVGIEKAGAPLATTVARELDTDIATYAPRKHQWDEEGDLDNAEGSFSRNFAGIRDRECYVVDDIITSGTTMTETIDAIVDAGGEPVACVVIVDKQGIEEIEGVPVYSLLQVVRVGENE